MSVERIGGRVISFVDKVEKKCGYCGEYYEEGYEGRLDNGYPACPQCVADEEAETERKHKEESEK